METTLAFVLVLVLVGLVVQGALVGVAWAALTRAAEDTARLGALCLNRPATPCTTADLAAALCQTLAGVDRRALTGTVATDGQTIQVWLRAPVPVVIPLGGQGSLPIGAAATRTLLYPGGRDAATPACS